MMEFISTETPSKRRGATRLAVRRFAVSLLLVITLIGSYRYYTRMRGHSALRPTTIDHSRFATPQDTGDRLVHAVNARRWRDEYECYTGAQQARFTYHVMVSIHELSDSQDLSVKLAHILQKFQFPLDLLDRFPSQRSEYIYTGDPMEIPPSIQEHHNHVDLQLERWQHEVQPLSIDWARLIEELQPLFIENYRRHMHHSHPSDTGIVWYLDYHLFKRVPDIKVNGSHAEGSIVAIIRDPEVFELSEVQEAWHGITLSDMLYHVFGIITFKDRRAKYPPERIEFVKVGDLWKVASVPFR